jgi:hypothetical protein
MILNRRQQRCAGFRFCRHQLNLINKNAIAENAMHQLKVVTAVALLLVTPVLESVRDHALF